MQFTTKQNHTPFLGLWKIKLDLTDFSGNFHILKV